MTKKLEEAVCAGAALALGGAVGFAGIKLLPAGLPAAVQDIVSLFSACLAALAGWTAISRVGRNAPDYPINLIDLGAIEPIAVPEAHDEPLELTEVFQAPLELTDVLAEVGPESRVVRLFDVSAMPTPSELQERIQRHLRRGPPSATPDASQALVDALTELRRSLR